MPTDTLEQTESTGASASQDVARMTATAAASVGQYDFGRCLRSQTLACRLRTEKLGTRKALDLHQRKEAAEPFKADHKSLSASKKLLDTRDPAYRAVRAVLTRAKNHWKSMTTPYPEPGIRLIRKSAVEAFVSFMRLASDELDAAAAALQEKYPELRERAALSLGDLFNDGDYVDRVDDSFSLEWDFPSVDPPAYLKNLHPELYEAECKKLEARFSLAVEQAETAFTQQFQKLVTHLVDRLTGEEDGKPKVFRDTAVENLNTFFEQFRNLDVGSSTMLQNLVNQAQAAVGGITATELRDQPTARETVSTALAAVAAQMDSLMVNKPDRKIELEDEA
jgi:hypothetical protein